MKKLFALLTLTFAATVILAQPLQVSFTPVTHNGYEISCFGGTDGSVTANPSGGTPPYTYKWSTLATTQTISNLPASYYAVTVTDANLNTATNGLNMREPQQISVTLTSPLYSNGYNVSCYQCYNGSITNTVSGGVSSYSYLWNGGVTTQNRSSINGNTAYTVTVTDGNGCTKQGAILISEPARSDWTMTGNTGSNPATNYIGTADNVDLVFKTNGTENLRLKANGNVGIGTSSPVEKLEVNGGLKVSGSLTANTLQLTGLNIEVGSDPCTNFLIAGPTGNVSVYDPNNCSQVPDLFWRTTGNNLPNVTGKFIGTINNSDFRIRTYNVERIVVKADGKVGIGTSTIPTDYLLAVSGKIIAEEVKVKLQPWPPDFVFEKDYKLMSLKDLDKYLEQFKHLPEIPSAAEMKKDDGIEVGDFQMKLLQKIEELTLYIIDQNKRIEKLESQIRK
jgi:sporulation protein YlmC with PRC-barrel domain